MDHQFEGRYVIKAVILTVELVNGFRKGKCNSTSI